MSFHYHGNWCGPGWSDGRRVPSTHGFAPAIDEFDETCRQHDFALSGGKSDLRADYDFVKANVGFNAKRNVAAALVASRAIYDVLTADNKTKNEQTSVKMNNQALRGSKQQPKPQKQRLTRPVSAPVSIGSMVRAVKTQHVQTKNGSILRGSDFIGTVEGQGVSTFGLGKAALLSPAYFLGTFLGNISRSYEKYRWKKLRIHYVPKVATTISGQIVLCSSHSCSEPALAGESGTFLQRALSQGNAAMGPLWMENHIDITCSGDFCMVDPSTTPDMDDAIAEELQVYVQTQSVGQVGYLYAEYEIEFTQLTFQPHSTIIPIPTGPGLRVAFIESSAIQTANDDFQLTDPANVLGLSTVTNGTIYRAVFDLQGSTVYAGGTSFAAGFQTLTAYRTAVSTTASATTVFPISGGTTLYLAVVGTAVNVYTSLEAAINGNGTGQVFIRNASTAVGNYLFDVALVRASVTAISQVQ